MTLAPERTVVGFVPAAVPDLDLVDSGRWRELGVTHWHLIADEIRTGDPIRYSAERWHGLSGARYTASATNPVDAWRWVCERRLAAIEATSDPAMYARRAGYGSEADWVGRCEMTWWMLTYVGTGRPGGGVSVSDGRSLDIFADPKTAITCTKH